MGKNKKGGKKGGNKNNATSSGAASSKPQMNKVKKDAQIFKVSNMKSKKAQQKAKAVPVKLKNVSIVTHYNY